MNKKINCIVCMLLICLLMCGCDPRNYFYTEDSLKRVAAKSLKEKYGEEFTIHRAWDKSQTMFFADCSPKDNPEIVFTADVRKNGDGILDDGYAQAVVSEIVDGSLTDNFKKIYGDCYTRAYITNYYDVPKIDNVKEITVKEYMNKTDLSFVGYEVYVDQETVSEEGIDDECNLLERKIPDLILKGDIPDVSIDIYFISDELLEQCKDFFTSHTDISYDLNEKLEKYDHIRIKYNNGIISETYRGSFVNPYYGEYRDLRSQIQKKDVKEEN